MYQPAPLTTFSLRTLLHRFRAKISLTVLLVILDAAANLLFPLFMGFAINDLLNGAWNGLVALGVLGLVSLLIGSLQRFYDTRVYAGIYETIANELVAKEQEKSSNVSKISARTGLLTELVEFMENSFPAVANSLIALVGTLIIIFSLNPDIFVACLLASLFVLAIYGLSGRANFKLNKGYNDQLEQQVNALDSADPRKIALHFKQLMRWNIKLSDLETLNYTLIWLAMIGLLIYAIYTAVGSGLAAYGTIFSLVVYVFEYINSVVTLPLYFQQLIRLSEISTRLNS